MSLFQVMVRNVDDIRNHENADRLTVVSIKGYEAVANKHDNGDFRFSKDELVVYVPEFAVIPDDVLIERGYWDTESERGILAGKDGNRVNAIKLRGIYSQGLIFKLETLHDQLILRRGNDFIKVNYGDDVSEFLGITKYVPEIPKELLGEVFACFDLRYDYDIENHQLFPDFMNDMEVEVTEKIHGVLVHIVCDPNVEHEDMFNGRVAVSSKGLSAKGMFFKNSVSNTHINAVKHVIDNVMEYAIRINKRVDIFGEVFGPGVQDLHYGTELSFRGFDVMIDNEMQNSDSKSIILSNLEIERVPVLYRGLLDKDIMVSLRDGKTTIGGKNIREGIVITSVGDQEKIVADDLGMRLRPIIKMVSPSYLTRKGGTEYS